MMAEFHNSPLGTIIVAGLSMECSKGEVPTFRQNSISITCSNKVCNAFQLQRYN